MGELQLRGGRLGEYEIKKIMVLSNNKKFLFLHDYACGVDSSYKKDYTVIASLYYNTIIVGISLLTDNITLISMIQAIH